MLVRIKTSYACAGIIVDEDGVCREAAPIFRWMIGKRLTEIRRWKKLVEMRVCEMEGVTAKVLVPSGPDMDPQGVLL